MLTDQQRNLIETVLSSDTYISAFQLLLDNSEIIDDEVLKQLLYISQSCFERGEYQAAQTIADLALCVDDQAEVKTRIDLLIAHGGALVALKRFENAIRMYWWAIEAAQEAGIIYGVPPALLMLGQLELQERQFEQGSQMIRSAITLAQQPDSGSDSKLLMGALALLTEALGQKEQDKDKVIEEVLSLIRAEYRHQISSYFLGSLEEDEFERLWIRSQARHYVELDFFPSKLFELAKVLIDQLNTGKIFPQRNVPSTNVLIDRRISNLPLTHMYTTLSFLKKHPFDASTLIHEVTHFLSFNSYLGGYFSLHSAVLYILEILLEKGYSVQRAADNDGGLSIVALEQLLQDRGAGLALLHSYLQYQAKVQMLWQVWRPWAEGLALYSEVDLDLTESGELWLPISRFLSGLPRMFIVEVGESTTGEELKNSILRDNGSPSQYTLTTINMAEQLQKRVRDVMLQSGYLTDVYVDNLSKQISDEYFVGYSLIHALWSSWVKRCPSLANSPHFFGVVMWLTRSDFGELIPDWQLPAPIFKHLLLDNFASFLHRLFEIPTDTLTEIVKDLDAGILPQGQLPSAALHDRTRDYIAYDLWHYIQTGERIYHSIDTWKNSIEQLKLAVFAQFTSFPEDFLKDLNNAITDVLLTMLNDSTLHLLSESDFEIRLLHVDTVYYLLGVGRGVQGGSAELLFFSLGEKEYRQFVAESRVKGDGAAKVYQFIVAQQHPQKGMSFAFPVVFKYGSLFISPRALREGGIYLKGMKVNKKHISQMKAFLSDKARIERMRAAQPLVSPYKDLMGILSALKGNTETTLKPETARLTRVQTTLEQFEHLVIRLYLSPLVSTESQNEMLLQNLLKYRLTALLPPDSDDRFYGKKVLYALSRCSDGFTRIALADQMKLDKADLDALLDRLRKHALETWNQELLVLDGDTVRLGGLQQVNTPSVQLH